MPSWLRSLGLAWGALLALLLVAAWVTGRRRARQDEEAFRRRLHGLPYPCRECGSVHAGACPGP